MKKYNDIAVVVPCYNVGKRPVKVIHELTKITDNTIVIDDGSTDETFTILRDLSDKIKLITFDKNRGKGFALLKGFDIACFLNDITCVVTIDGDGQHDPLEIPRLYEGFKKHNADLVIGARTFDKSNVPLRSRFGNIVTLKIVKLLLKHPIEDTQSGFRLHSLQFVRHILDHVEGGRYETEMEILTTAVVRLFKVVSVPIKTIYETGNRSSHFHVVRDSLLIYKKLLSTKYKY